MPKTFTIWKTEDTMISGSKPLFSHPTSSSAIVNKEVSKLFLYLVYILCASACKESSLLRKDMKKFVSAYTTLCTLQQACLEMLSQLTRSDAL